MPLAPPLMVLLCSAEDALGSTILEAASGRQLLQLLMRAAAPWEGPRRLTPGIAEHINGDDHRHEKDADVRARHYYAPNAPDREERVAVPVLCRRRQLELVEHDHLEARRKRRELGEDRHALDELVRVQALLVDSPPALL